MKVVRTSFSQFVRNKILQSEDVTHPDPVWLSTAPTGIDGESLGLPVRWTQSDGSVLWVNPSGGILYREQQSTHSGQNTAGIDMTWTCQGNIGFGNQPVGPGTSPFTTTITNAKLNSVAQSRGIITGITVEPELSIPKLTFNMPSTNSPGFGCTFATGQLEQKTVDMDGTQIDMKCSPGKHVLITLDSKFRTAGQVGSGNSYSCTTPESTVPYDKNNKIHFIYEAIDDSNFKLYPVRGDWSGYQDVNNIPANTLTTPEEFQHFNDFGNVVQNTYGRLVPVSFLLKPDGSGEFRVDNAKIVFNITGMTGVDGTPFMMPSDGSGEQYTVRGLYPYNNNPAVNGMENPIVVLANLAINDSDNTDGLNNHELPPFIAGVPMTPIRRTQDHDEQANERAVSTVDTLKSTTGIDNWVSYAYSGEDIIYANKLEAVMDGQNYDIRGVASTSLSAPLTITIDDAQITPRYADIAAVTVDAINVSVDNAAVYGSTPDELSIAVLLSGTGLDWTTGWKRASGLDKNPENDSHVTIFQKYDLINNKIDDFSLTDFQQDFVISTQVMHTSGL